MGNIYIGPKTVRLAFQEANERLLASAILFCTKTIRNFSCVCMYRERIKETHIYNRKKLFLRVTLCVLAPKHPLLFPFSDIVVGVPQPLLFGRGELCSLAEKQTIFLMNCTRLQPGEKIGCLQGAPPLLENSWCSCYCKL